jgi:hypothetical protein
MNTYFVCFKGAWGGKKRGLAIQPGLWAEMRQEFSAD